MDYKAAVNPAFLTAKSTVFMLAGAGNEDAKKVIEGLNLMDALSSQKTDDNPFSKEDANAYLTGVTVAVEGRYNALSRFLNSGEWKGLLDIACGYTPRSLFCHKAGISYAGLDVPAAVEELEQFADKEGLGKIYTGGDATNAASLIVASDKLQDPILVSTEGLWGYLFKEEFEQLAGGVRQILIKHGGAWVSSDMGVNYADYATANMSGDEAVEKYHEQRRKSLGNSNIYNEGVSYWEADKVKELLESCGFKVETLPFYYGDENLNTLTTIPDAWKEKYLRLLEKSFIWKMTPDENYVEKAKITGAKNVDNLDIDYEATDELRCVVKGRIDTISSPALLEVFDKNYDQVKSITVIADELEYISSAGLRVLMMAVKKLGEGKVKVTGTSEAVKEIFKTTGFDEFIVVE